MRSEEVTVLIIAILGSVLIYALISSCITEQNKREKETIQYIKQYPQCASARNPHYCGYLLEHSSK